MTLKICCVINSWYITAILPLLGPRHAPVIGSQGIPGPQLQDGTSTAENKVVTTVV